MQSNENWRPVLGYEGKYEVSDMGRVRSLPRSDTLGRPVRGRMLKLANTPRGYQSVSISDERGVRNAHVHTLVLEAFVGARPDGMEACHGEGGARDNRLMNLRWDTHSENMIDRSRHGTCANRTKATCSRGHQLDHPNLVASQWKKGWRSCLACNRAFGKKSKNPRIHMQSESDAYYQEIMAGRKLAS